jgi:hypothetical protein
MANIIDNFEQIFSQVTTEKFLSMQALGGEIPFFIYAFDPVAQDLVSNETLRLKKRVEQSGNSVLSINLYSVMIELLQERKMLEKVLERESSMTQEKLLKSLHNMLDAQTKIIPYIKTLVESSKTSMVFIEGVGEVYPYIRSHTILNNLQNVILDRPALMFFPGEFDGHSLKLFGKFKDDNYYRAFNISKYKFQG